MSAALRRVAQMTMAGSLGRKLLVILAAVGIAGSVAIAVFLAAIIVPSFDSLERGAVAGHVERTRAVLTDYAAKVEGAVRDYGDWNSSYDYMANPTKAFEEESFSTLAMTNLAVNGMAYVAPDGRIVIARWIDGEREQPAMRTQLAATIAHTDFARVVGNDSSGKFYARLGSALVAIGVARVRKSDGSGTPRGFVLMARQVTSRQLADLLQLDARLDLTAPPANVVTTPHRDTMEISVPVAGADGRPVAATRYAVPRDVSLLGRRMLLLAVGGAVALLFVVLFALRQMIARLVLRPLHRVEQHMQVVRASGTLSMLDDEARNDEIGSLGKSFNAMLNQLKDLREQLEVQSFALGKSESAVAVMHNVRNALNPISAILSQGIALAPPVDRALLDRAVAELAQDDLPAARRQKLAAFVNAALSAEAGDRTERTRQLQTGREAMGHVLEIIGSQQAAAHERPALEVCDVTELVARNATIARYSGQRSAAISFPARPHLAMANRLILSQVIGNIFGNATEAIAASPTGGTIMVEIDELDGAVTIAIRDDGEGFDPETATQLFQRGYSTRSHKSGGLGLHWCANSMVAMEGSMRLISEGAGRGATAILTLKASVAAATAQEIAA
ncbi:MAG: CHASE4 domain-containing protein [Pseudomonadota bacterium]